MLLKKFSSRTVPDALAAVRRELGADAVILSTRRAGTGDRAFEVVAAIDEPGPSPFPRVDRAGNPMDDGSGPRPRPRAVAHGGKILDTSPAPAAAPATSAATGTVVSEEIPEEEWLRTTDGHVDGDPAPRPASRGYASREAAFARAPSGEGDRESPERPSGSMAPAPATSTAIDAPTPEPSRSDARPRSGSSAAPSGTGDAAPSEPSAGGAVDRVSLLDELAGLRGRLETMTDLLLAAAPQDLSERGRRMHLRLTESGLDPRMATAVIRRAERVEGDEERALGRALAASIRPGGALETGVGQQVIALVGPTGVGKTTTCAKLAAHLAIAEGRSVALISADSFRVGGAQQLGFYGEILEVPFHTAHDRTSLVAAIKRSGNAEVILVDTTGRGSVDIDGAQEIGDTLAADPRTQTWLVLSATSRIEDNLSALRTFARVRPSGLCLTKLDETASHGAGATVAIRSALPLRYLADGQTVPDDLHAANPDDLARLVLEGRAR